MTGVVSFFCLTVPILIWLLWDRIKIRRRLANLIPRIRQLEELLLEVCAVLEKDLKKQGPETACVVQTLLLDDGQPSARQQEQQVESLPSGDEARPHARNHRIGQAETMETVNNRPAEEEAREEKKKEKNEEKKEEKKEERVSETRERPASATPEYDGREDFAQLESQVGDRRRQVLELFHQGIPVKTIARRIGMGQGEAQLIIDLYARRGEQEK